MRLKNLFRLAIALLIPIVTACSTSSLPYRHNNDTGDVECSVATATKDKRCHTGTPEVSKAPPYTLHFVEFDDQGWLYPDAGQSTHENQQINRAIDDIRQRLDANERVLLLVFVHGWKHSAAYDDRDVMRFRQMLADAANLDARNDVSNNRKKRSVVGIYVGWRGAGALSSSNPLLPLTFWTRKNAALHISAGASRELFARIEALRERVNTPEATPQPLRSVVIGHSFGAWIVYSALSPSILELLASPLDKKPDPSSETEQNKAMQTAWRKTRRQQAADMVVLVNPAFEASRYQPIQSVAQRLGKKFPEYEPPVLVLVTSTADSATRYAFPFGRFFNTLFQHPFTSDDQELATKHAPGFIDTYQTHTLTRRPDAQIAQCTGWLDPPTGVEQEPVRKERMRENALCEGRHQAAWLALLNKKDKSLELHWERQFCGGAFLTHQGGEPHAPVWNVLTDSSLITDHSDIMGEPFHAFLRQLYLDLSDQTRSGRYGGESGVQLSIPEAAGVACQPAAEILDSEIDKGR